MLDGNVVVGFGCVVSWLIGGSLMKGFDRRDLYGMRPRDYIGA